LAIAVIVITPPLIPIWVLILAYIVYLHHMTANIYYRQPMSTDIP